MRGGSCGAGVSGVGCVFGGESPFKNRTSHHKYKSSKQFP